MGTIIGEGITFDDVLSGSGIFRSNSESGRCYNTFNEKNQAEHSDDECRNGYSYRTSEWQLRWPDRAVSVSFTKICRLKQQAEEVDKVKRSENGVITDPFFFLRRHTLEDANNLMAKFRISGVPITEGRKLVGIITNRDLKFEDRFHKEDQRMYDFRGTDHSQRRNHT